MNRLAAFACLPVLVAFGACHSAPPRLLIDDADYPGILRAAESLPIDVVWQQRVTASWGKDQQRGFDAAIQKRGATLTVIGLSPMGEVGFAIGLRGGVVEVQNQTGERLPFPPRFILLDVQRAYYPWFRDFAAAAEAAARDGTDVALVDGEQVTERWLAGRLVQRTFRRVDGTPAGEIVVRYEWQRDDWRGPTRVVLDNQWFGYRLTIDTHAETLLPGGDGG